jgi:preprotein translocase subunit SecB
MAEEGNGGQATTQKQPSLKIVSQYVKDLSFENPGAPQSLQARKTAPNINISIAVQARSLSPNETEVELKLEAKAEEGDDIVFAIELVYAGVFRMENIPQENLEPLTMIECPRLIFPFARQIMAEASRNGGFPPLLIDPIDFAGLYRQQHPQQPAPGAPAN